MKINCPTFGLKFDRPAFALASHASSLMFAHLARQADYYLGAGGWVAEKFSCSEVDSDWVLTLEVSPNYASWPPAKLIQRIQELEKDKAMAKELKEYPAEELHRELLGRLTCQFNRAGCSKVAEDWLIKPFNYQKDPVCLPCKWKILEQVKADIEARKAKKEPKK